MIAPLITLLNVTKLYSQGNVPVVALRDVSVTIEAGECVAIMGSSGSGKSTFLNLIGCIDVPTHGSVSIDGQLTTQSRRCRIDCAPPRQGRNDLPIFQSSRHPHRPPECGIADAPGRVPTETAWQRADELLALVGLKERTQHRPYQLSGGEMQRVAIARALANNPAVLLADEPTGNLDSRTGSEILSLLMMYCRSQQKTMILATHDHAAAARADRVLQLRDGSLQP